VSAIKKTLSHPKADENARSIFQDKIKAYQADNKPIVYLDESGFANELPRTHGYAPIGKRCAMHTQRASPKSEPMSSVSYSLLVGLPRLSTGSVNADMFVAWLSQNLLPKLLEKAVIVMDNASFYKR
jgi:hypothetical protein